MAIHREIISVDEYDEGKVVQNRYFIMRNSEDRIKTIVYDSKDKSITIKGLCRSFAISKNYTARIPPSFLSGEEDFNQVNYLGGDRISVIVNREELKKLEDIANQFKN